MSSTRIFADDTPLPVLDPGRGRTKTGRLWGYAVDDRPWQGPAPPAVVYLYAEDRKGEHPATHLAGFTGILQVDGYGGFKSLAGDGPSGPVRLAFCWAHCRRYFYDCHQATGSPMAVEALRRIGGLYTIEAEIRGRPAEERRAARQEHSRPLVDALRTWLVGPAGAGLGQVRPGRGDPLRPAPLAGAGPVPRRRPGRARHQRHRAGIRPIALGKKNSLFAGSDGGARHWAIVASLMATAKLNGVEPLAWLNDVLERMVTGRTKAHELDDLLPWTGRQQQPSTCDSRAISAPLTWFRLAEAEQESLNIALASNGDEGHSNRPHGYLAKVDNREKGRTGAFPRCSQRPVRLLTPGPCRVNLIAASRCRTWA